MGECYLHTVEVTGSNPVPPTIDIEGLQLLKVVSPFLIVCCICSTGIRGHMV